MQVHLALIVLVGAIAALAQDCGAAAAQPTTRPANLVSNGEFEQGDADGKLPLGWTTKHPDNVRRVWSDEERGYIVEMTGDEKLMGGYGADLTSDRIAVRANTRYRCTGLTRSVGPSFIVFVKGYATVTRRVKGQSQTFDDAVYQMRKEIKPSADWQPFNLDFDITPADVFSDQQHEIRYLRITLWAYWPAGTGWFDDIRFEEAGALPSDRVRRPDPVTHTGVKPRLGPGSQPATAEAAFDEEQTWLDAANAFRAGEYAKAAVLGEQLVARAPRKADYHLLLARTLAKLERWVEADQHAGWLLDEPAATKPACSATRPAEPTTQPTRQIEPWQRDWALVVRAEARWRAGRLDEARQCLQRVLRPDASPHARQAAEELGRRIDGAAP